jgi:sugar phosphate isomerase/epimerase
LRGRLDWLAGVQDPWGFAAERLAEVGRYAADRGVRLTLEPINRYEVDFIASVDDGLRMVEAIGLPNVGLMLDLYHMNIEDASIEGGLQNAGDRCWHVHIADSNRLYPGAGHIDFPPIFEMLRRMGYEGYVSAELLPKPDPDTAAELTIAFLRKYI